MANVAFILPAFLLFFPMTYLAATRIGGLKKFGLEKLGGSTILGLLVAAIPGSFYKATELYETPGVIFLVPIVASILVIIVMARIKFE